MSRKRIAIDDDDVGESCRLPACPVQITEAAAGGGLAGAGDDRLHRGSCRHRPACRAPPSCCRGTSRRHRCQRPLARRRRMACWTVSMWCSRNSRASTWATGLPSAEWWANTVRVGTRVMSLSAIMRRRSWSKIQVAAVFNGVYSGFNGCPEAWPPDGVASHELALGMGLGHQRLEFLPVRSRRRCRGGWPARSPSGTP